MGNVYTLNNEFFGSYLDESKLTVQSDVIDIMLNDKTLGIGLLPTYRNAVINNTVDIDNALSFINCSYDNKQQCIDTCKSYINNYKGPIGNALLKPYLWEINNNSQKNVLNSCPIVLNTSKNYNTPVKYAKFHVNGKTSLSLYGGGEEEQLMFDKPKVIKESSNGQCVLITTNLMTNSGLYLVPTFDQQGFYNSSVVRGVSEPSPNGKWLIIGFPLNNLNDLMTLIQSIKF